MEAAGADAGSCGEMRGSRKTFFIAESGCRALRFEINSLYYNQLREK